MKVLTVLAIVRGIGRGDRRGEHGALDVGLSRRVRTGWGRVDDRIALEEDVKSLAVGSGVADLGALSGVVGGQVDEADIVGALDRGVEVLEGLGIAGGSGRGTSNGRVGRIVFEADVGVWAGRRTVAIAFRLAGVRVSGLALNEFGRNGGDDSSHDGCGGGGGGETHGDELKFWVGEGGVGGLRIWRRGESECVGV